MSAARGPTATDAPPPRHVAVVERLLRSLVRARTVDEAAHAVVNGLVRSGGAAGAEVLHVLQDDEPALVVATAGSGGEGPGRRVDDRTVLRVAGPRVPGGTLGLVVEALREALARARELEQLRLDAQTDPLTGLRNRRAFDRRLEEELSRASREATPVALLLVDVDDLKVVNDRDGHPAGDDLLRRVGRELGRLPRTSDLAARIGGDEFAVVLPGTGLAGAVVVTDRLHRQLAGDGGRNAVSVSVGIATTEWTVAQADRLTAAADRALYRAKAEGKGRLAADRDVVAASRLDTAWASV